MNCKKIEKWISDDLDGSLPPKRKPRIERHLEACISCRTHREELVRLQSAASKLFEESRGREFWEGFDKRLKVKLTEPGPFGGFPFFRRKWVWAGVAGLFLAAVGFRLIVHRASVLPGDLAMSHEESLAALLLEVGTDPALARSFSEYIEVSIRETIGFDALASTPRFRDDPLFWESLSDEELIYLEKELLAQSRLTEVPHESL